MEEPKLVELHDGPEVLIDIMHAVKVWGGVAGVYDLGRNGIAVNMIWIFLHNWKRDESRRRLVLTASCHYSNEEIAALMLPFDADAKSTTRMVHSVKHALNALYEKDVLAYRKHTRRALAFTKSFIEFIVKGVDAAERSALHARNVAERSTLHRSKSAERSTLQDSDSSQLSTLHRSNSTERSTLRASDTPLPAPEDSPMIPQAGIEPDHVYRERLRREDEEEDRRQLSNLEESGRRQSSSSAGLKPVVDSTRSPVVIPLSGSQNRPLRTDQYKARAMGLIASNEELKGLFWDSIDIKDAVHVTVDTIIAEGRGQELLDWLQEEVNKYGVTKMIDATDKNGKRLMSFINKGMRKGFDMEPMGPKKKMTP